VAPKVPYAHLAKARALMALEQKEGALAATDKAIAVAPRLADAHKARALVLEALGRRDEAQASREQAEALAKS
jgi:tetratricopeptide (TPR) repeat protein